MPRVLSAPAPAPPPGDRADPEPAGAGPALRRALLPLVAALATVVSAPACDRDEGVPADGERAQRAVAADPGDPRAHDALGAWHLEHGRLSAAQRSFEQALARAPDDAAARVHLGELWRRRALVPGAEAHLREARAVLEGVETPAAWALLGEVLQRAGDARAAVALLERATEAEPDDGATLTHLGMARLKLQDVAGARSAFQRATELAPDAVEAWCGLGIACFSAGDVDVAEASLARALALEPDHVESNATRGRIQEQRGARAEAEASYRRALAVNPSYVDALYALGAMLAADGRGDEALRWLDRLCELPAAQPHVRGHLESARLHLARGERELARARIAAVLAFNPEHPDARALLQRLEDGD